MSTFLRKQEVIYASFVAAGIISYALPDVAQMLREPGVIYLSLFQMAILPLIFCSVISSAAIIVDKRHENVGTLRVLSLYVGGMIGCGILGLLLPSFFDFGQKIATNHTFLNLSNASEDDQITNVLLSTPIESTQSIWSVVSSIFTRNIFQSFIDAAILQLLPIAFLIGSASAFLPEEKKTTFLNVVSAIDLIFKKIITWIIVFLPAGIIFIFSSAFVTLSADLLLVFFPCLLLMLGSMVVCCIVFTFLIARRTNLSSMAVLSKFKETLIVLTGTTNFISAMPFYMKALKQEFDCNPNKVDLFIPVTVPIFRFGNVFHFAFIAIIAAQIFSIPLSATNYITLLMMTIFAGFSSVSSGLINITLLGLILSPVNVPFSLMIILFSVMEPIIDPIRTIFGLYVNFTCAIFGFVPKRTQQGEQVK
ncbi:MAG: cation:dicarboxylase symporter family transporter [Alphaproteobacteria bacterium]|nr:cation:dicarboxylase symporter family transporter [Alphaproteobacteria bacterium]